MAKKSQIDKFRETARSLKANESEEDFDVALKRVATSKVREDGAPPAKAKKSKEGR